MHNFLLPVPGWIGSLILKVALCFRLLCVCLSRCFWSVLFFGFLLSIIFLLICVSVCWTCQIFCSRSNKIHISGCVLSLRRQICNCISRFGKIVMHLLLLCMSPSLYFTLEQLRCSPLQLVTQKISMAGDSYYI